MNSVDSFQQKHVSFSIVKQNNLPFHCPPKDAKKWNMHPKIFLKFDQGGKPSCPYCGTHYRLQ